VNLCISHTFSWLRASLFEHRDNFTLPYKSLTFIKCTQVNDIRQTGIHKSETFEPDCSFSEVDISIAKWKNYESSVNDQIPAELIQADDETLRSLILFGIGKCGILPQRIITLTASFLATGHLANQCRTRQHKCLLGRARLAVVCKGQASGAVRKDLSPGSQNIYLNIFLIQK
jgi:hypothetical protein